jgi:flagellar motor switch protein FliN/FliY
MQQQGNQGSMGGSMNMGGNFPPMGGMQNMGSGQQQMGYPQQMMGMGQGMPYQSPVMGMSQPNVQPVQFANLGMSQHSQESGNIGLIMDVYMELTVELGRTKKLIKDILGIGEGTIIELDKLAGEPVDILVNHKLIAKGEVVVIDENFGVRVTEIVSPMERMAEMS